MSQELQKSGNTSLSFITPEQISKYQEVDKQVGELISSGLTGIALTFAKVTVVEQIEKVLDPDFMAKVMNLKGKEYGFKTDEKAGEQLSVDKVKSVIVQAMLFGAEITGNEINILGGNCYLTKNFCKNWLRKNKVWYKLTPYLSKKIEVGTSSQWVIPMLVEWADFQGNRFKETLEIPVNKFSNTSEATMRGQADRDGMAYIIEELRKESVPINRNEDFVEVHEIKQESKAEFKQQVSDAVVEIIKEAVDVANAQPVVVDQLKVSAEIQSEFNTFINNKNKVKTIQDLTNRAKAFCADKEIKTPQLNLDKYNEIKASIDGGTWL